MNLSPGLRSTLQPTGKSLSPRPGWSLSAGGWKGRPDLLGGLAEFERELIKARTAEGRQRAKARGVRFGRKLKLSRHQIAEALARREAGEALTEIGRGYTSSLYNLAAEP